MTTKTTQDRKTDHKYKISRLDRLYEDQGGFDFIGRSKIWYAITAALVVASFLFIAIRGFSLSLDFEGGTQLNMPADNLVAEEVGKTFEDATGVEPELVQIVGAGDSETLEITSERLTQEQVDTAREAIFRAHHTKDENGKETPDAIGSSTVSESWGASITSRMLLAMGVFLVVATIYVAIRLQRTMAFAAIFALLIDGVIIAGIYAAFGFEVSPAVIIGLLTVLTFSIYDSVIVFDKVNENTEGLTGQRKATYAEQANLAVNQTVMRSISTSVISALPIVALFVVAVWLMGIGTLRDLALIQLIGVIEGIFSSLFLATPLVVTLAHRTQRVKDHNARVERYRAKVAAGEETPSAGEGEEAPEEAGEGAGRAKRTVASPASARAAGRAGKDSGTGSAGATWRPGR